MRYGENPHQKAAFYQEKNLNQARLQPRGNCRARNCPTTTLPMPMPRWSASNPLEAGPLAYRQTCQSVRRCRSRYLLSAYELAYATDPTSAFGGIIAFNRELDKETAAEIIKRQFVEVIIAPFISADAQDRSGRETKRKGMECGDWTAKTKPRWISNALPAAFWFRTTILAKSLPPILKSSATRADGTGTGRSIICLESRQICQIQCHRLLQERPDHRCWSRSMSRSIRPESPASRLRMKVLVMPGSVMASDAFFPFRDGIDSAAEAGISAIIHPGGSIRDEEVIEPRMKTTSLWSLPACGISGID